MWDFLALECGDQIAIIDPIHPPEGADAERVGKGAETRLTYSEVRASVRKMAGALAELGVQRGVRIERKKGDLEAFFYGGGVGRRRKREMIMNDVNPFETLTNIGIRIIGVSNMAHSHCIDSAQVEV